MAAPHSPLLLRILAASVSVSNRAAGIVRDIMTKGDLGIVKKGKHDIQTEADRAAQKCIVASLHRHFPKICIHAEESLDSKEHDPEDLIETELCKDVLSKPCPPWLQDVKDEEVVVWVDPMDGTVEYTKGLLDHVTVLIGVSVRGKATAGVINQPYYNYNTATSHHHHHQHLGRCVWGLVGLGAFGYDRHPLARDENIITTTRTHSNRVVNGAVEACLPTQVIHVGGAGYKVLMVMEGGAHAYVYASGGCKKWDTCAPEAVLHAAGGQLTDLLGRPISYHAHAPLPNASGVLATADRHDWYVDHIPDDIKQLFREGSSIPPRSSL